MTQRGRRSRAALEVVSVASTDRPDAPEGLQAAAAALWRAIVQSLPPDYFRPADFPVLAAYCETVVQHEEATRGLRGQQMVLEAPNGRLYRHPMLAVQHTAALRMASLAVKLRLCPSTRYGARKAETLNAGRPGRKPWQDAAG